jgi:germination protein M
MFKSDIVRFGFIMLLIFMLTGCFKGEQSLEEIDVPKDAEAVDHTEEGSQGEVIGEAEGGEEEEIVETIARQLYLVDVNGLVVAQTLELPKEDHKEVATQVLTYLVKGGPVTPILPNGFQAVLPEGTEILGLNLQEDGTLVVDVSKEFEEYEAKDELKILEAMTYTLTQFENVDRIELWINGYPQDEMPVNGTPIKSGYSRVNGINLMATETIDLTNSQAVTMYYPSEYNENRYYVPITQHVEIADQDIFSPIVQSLITGPSYHLNVIDVFNVETSLIDRPTLENGILKLVFNEEILKDMDHAVISDEVMETLVRTLTEHPKVEAIEVEVENVDQLVNENGEIYSEPVTKDEFMNIEKL